VPMSSDPFDLAWSVAKSEGDDFDIEEHFLHRKGILDFLESRGRDMKEHHLRNLGLMPRLEQPLTEQPVVPVPDVRGEARGERGIEPPMEGRQMDEDPKDQREVPESKVGEAKGETPEIQPENKVEPTAPKEELGMPQPPEGKPPKVEDIAVEAKDVTSKPPEADAPKPKKKRRATSKKVVSDVPPPSKGSKKGAKTKSPIQIEMAGNPHNFPVNNPEPRITQLTGELSDDDIVPGHFTTLYSDAFGETVLGPGDNKKMDRAVNRAMKENKTYQQALSALLEITGGRLPTLADRKPGKYAKPSPAEKKDDFKIPTMISEGTDRDVVDRIVILAEEGNDEAYTTLLNNSAELEDYFPEAHERYEELRSMRKSFILKDPFANPFHNPNFLDVVNIKREMAQPMSPIIKSHPIQERVKPDIGFDTVEGDDLSLLPASIFMGQDNSVGMDDMSLLPTGWRNE